MATLEDIVAGVLVLVVFLVAGLFMTSQYSRAIADKDRLWILYDQENKYSSMFDSLLLVTEQETGRSFGDLLGSAAYYRDDLILTTGGQMRIEAEFKELLDAAFPSQNYYVEVEAPLQQFELVFIVDGSDTMKDESLYLANYSTAIAESAQNATGIPVTMLAYILSYPNLTWCDNYTSMACEYYTPDMIYVNDTYTVFDLVKKQKKLEKPYHYYDEPEVWMSDWETALSSLVLFHQGTDLNIGRVYLPLTDGLPSSTQFFYPCPKDYATSILVRDVDILRESNVIVDPVFSTTGDPVMYCDPYVIDHMNTLMHFNNGVVIKNQDNLMRQLPGALLENLDQLKIRIGEKRMGRAFAIERKLPMPNGDLANARLYIYDQE